MKFTHKKHQELLNTINNFHDENSNSLTDFTVTEIVSFLEASHDRFIHAIIPKIEQNFLVLNDYFQDNNNLKILFKLFLKFEQDFKQHIAIEENTLFPYAKNIYKASVGHSVTQALFIHFGKYSVKDFIDGHKNNECYLTEIIFLFQKQTEMHDHTIYNVLMKQMCQLDNEIKTHGWIEDNVLVNKVMEIENALEKFVNEVKSYE